MRMNRVVVFCFALFGVSLFRCVLFVFCSVCFCCWFVSPIRYGSGEEFMTLCLRWVASNVVQSRRRRRCLAYLDARESYNFFISTLGNLTGVLHFTFQTLFHLFWRGTIIISLLWICVESTNSTKLTESRRAARYYSISSFNRESRCTIPQLALILANLAPWTSFGTL